ncbi:exonuclease VII small subunit [Candidatus Pelagibacter sp.]|nr:exonuclease VII small subunit [Candidatus Pelagibacter sp.]
MKLKNLPDDNASQSLEKLTKDANKIIEKLENEKNLQDSVDSYQKLIKLNNEIEKKFQKKIKQIKKNSKEQINKIITKKNEK